MLTLVCHPRTIIYVIFSQVWKADVIFPWIVLPTLFLEESPIEPLWENSYKGMQEEGREGISRYWNLALCTYFGGKPTGNGRIPQNLPSDVSPRSASSFDSKNWWLWHSVGGEKGTSCQAFNVQSPLRPNHLPHSQRKKSFKELRHCYYTPWGSLQSVLLQTLNKGESSPTRLLLIRHSVPRGMPL